jgi:VWFA-related protein
MRRRFCWTLILVAAWAASASSAFGQAPAAEQAPANSAAAQPGTVFRMTTNLVLVDVVVTEKGKAVHGLDRSKFHLFEDGQEQPIANFDERLPAAVPAALPAPPVLPPHTYNNVPAYPATGVVNVLLLDGLNTPQTDQMRTRQQMIEYMGKIQPGTMMAVFTLSSRLRMVTGFTTDVAQLTKAVKDQRTENPNMLAGPTAPEALDGIQSYFDTLKKGGGGTAALTQFEKDVAQTVVDQRIRITLEAMKQLGFYLSAIPGRKNLIWFSGSIPAALDPSGSSANSAQETVVSYLDDVRKTNDLLMAARVAVYPVDARGTMTDLPYDPSNRGSLAISSALKDFSSQLIAEHDTMRQVAEQTGGQSYINTNGLKEAVASAVENGSSYYTLAYAPPAKKLDARYHKIEVHLDASGDQLSYRRGYFADAPDKSSAHSPGSKGLIAVATLQGAPPATQILFLTRVLPDGDPQIGGVKPPEGPAGEMSATLKGPRHRYIVDVQIDPRTLAFVEGPEGQHQADFDCALIAYSAEGQRLNYADRSFSIAPKADQYKGILAYGLPVRLALDLPAGEQFLRIVVHDKTVDRVGALEIPLAVAAN